MDRSLPDDLRAIVQHLESSYPHEGCGLILRAKGPGDWRIRPMSNAYDRYHARDPARFPRTAKTAYLFDPKEWLAVLEETDQRREDVICVYHSHIDAGAYFSAEDRVMAAPDGEPLLPGVTYLVVAIDGGRASEAKLFWWEQGQFRESSIALAAQGID